MRFFDLHCDTVGECCKNNIPLRSNCLHVDLQRSREFRGYTQVFAIWIPDDLRGKQAVEYFNKTADYFYSELEKNKDLISLYFEDAQTPVTAILSVEGGSACGGTIDGLRNLRSRGVKIITLTWNGKNEIGAGAFSEGGITEFGKEFIGEAEHLGVVLDVSHLNKRSFFEFAELSEMPFIASHSNVDIVNTDLGRKRNLSKEQIEIIKSRHGLVGLNFCTDFIDDDKTEGVASLCRQIDYMLSLGCEDVIAFGSDFDGCRVCDDFNGIEKIPRLWTALNSGGFDEKILKKLFYENADSFFKRIKTEL